MVHTAEARGTPTADLLHAAGLSFAQLEDPDARIPAPTVLAVWNALRERTADPALQLVAPLTLPYGSYRVIDYLVAASTTVGEGIERFVRFFALIADALALSIDRTGDLYELQLSGSDGGPVPPVYVDYVFAALVGRIRMRARPELRVARVQLRQPEPAQCAPYQQTFGARIEFGAPADRLCFSADEWNARVEGSDAALARVLEEHARIMAARLPTPGTDFRARVQQRIAEFPAQSGSAADVARALHVSVRTLHRRLLECGTTFRKVADDVRGELARGYLADGRVSIAEVAFLLGFSDQSSFNRAFRRWAGQSPGRWRRHRAPR